MSDKSSITDNKIPVTSCAGCVHCFWFTAKAEYRCALRRGDDSYLEDPKEVFCCHHEKR